MTDQRLAVIAEARRWIETPVRHQHAIPGFGVDCWGHVREVGVACEVLPYDDAAFEPFRGYGEQPSPRVVLGVCETFLVPTTDPEPADIACIEWRPGLPMHLAILGLFEGRQTLIHAYRSKGRVVEHGFTAEWPRMVHSWWRYPGLAG